MGGSGRSAPAAGRGKRDSPGCRARWSGGARGSAGSAGGRRAPTRSTVPQTASPAACQRASWEGARIGAKRADRASRPIRSRRTSDAAGLVQRPPPWTMRNRSRSKDRGDEEQGQPVQEPDHRVENAQFGIAIGPQHLNTSLSCPCRAGRRGDRIGRSFTPAAAHACRILDENGFWFALARFW